MDCLSHDWAQPGYQRPTLISHTGGGSGGETDRSILAFILAVNAAPAGLLKTGVSGLSHYKVPENVWYLLYRFPGSHIGRELSHHRAKSPCRPE